MCYLVLQRRMSAHFFARCDVAQETLRAKFTSLLLAEKGALWKLSLKASR